MKHFCNTINANTKQMFLFFQPLDFYEAIIIILFIAYSIIYFCYFWFLTFFISNYCQNNNFKAKRRKGSSSLKPIYIGNEKYWHQALIHKKKERQKHWTRNFPKFEPSFCQKKCIPKQMKGTSKQKCLKYSNLKHLYFIPFVCSLH